MNIFYLEHSPELSAQSMADKHIVKMIVETAQLLSTAHRVLDGTLKIVDGKKNIFYQQTIWMKIYILVLI